MFTNILQPWFCITTIGDDITNMHKSAEGALFSIPHGNISPIRDGATSYVHTVGSYDSSTGLSSWAFTVMSLCGDNYIYHGACVGSVTIDSNNRFYVGSGKHSSLAGELEALVWSLLWACGFVMEIADRGLKVGIRYMYDCTAAVGDTQYRPKQETRPCCRKTSPATPRQPHERP